MQDIQSKEKIASLNVARELVIHGADQQAAQRELEQDSQQRSADRLHKLSLAHMGHRAKAQQGVADRTHDLISSVLSRGHEADQNAIDRQHQLAMRPQESQGVAP